MLAIVTECQSLARHWEWLRTKSGGSEAFSKVIQSTKTALKAAAESDFTPGMVFDYSSASTKTVQTSINAAVEHIQEIIEQASKFNNLFGEARAKDQALLSDLKTRLSAETPLVEKHEMIKVEVEIRDIGSIKAKTMDFMIKSTDTLSVLLFCVCARIPPSDAAVLRTRGVFKRDIADNQEMSTATPANALQGKVFLVEWASSEA
ncbi:unnamed protein product [Mycena citricolor]|uniref:Uncharacterized protein n=1 Tax=Mycena citricolor TaxID=2018698 RepID=A0AAD2HJ31_9AGAR|nr:unnamed protein product [Mycena citricolor]